MKHEDGYCDACGAEVPDAPLQITVDGSQVCEACVLNPPAPRVAKRPEARDDGR